MLKNRGLITCEHCLRADRYSPISKDQYYCDIEYRRFAANGHHSIDSFRTIDGKDIVCLPSEAVDYPLPVLLEDKSYRPHIGETVTAYGFADGDSTLRVIKATIAEIFQKGETFRVDRPFIKGMSGGPVINARGKVIGIITQGSSSEDYSKDGYFCSIKLLSNIDDASIENDTTQNLD